MSVLPSHLGGSKCAQRQGMGGTLVPGADTVTMCLPRECHMKGRVGKYWASVSVRGFYPLE